jgi:hypothetical protein
MEHRMIRRDHIGFKDLDSICRSDIRKLAKQDGAESASLKVVGNGKGNLGALVVNANIEGMAHDALLVTTACNQSKSLVQVRLSMSFGSEPSAILQTVKSQPAGVFR